MTILPRVCRGKVTTWESQKGTISTVMKYEQNIFQAELLAKPRSAFLEERTICAKTEMCEEGIFSAGISKKFLNIDYVGHVLELCVVTKNGKTGQGLVILRLWNLSHN